MTGDPALLLHISGYCICRRPATVLILEQTSAEACLMLPGKALLRPGRCALLLLLGWDIGCRVQWN
jgi:hypothetical protein